jgi:uncharacterized protein YjiS (DUF1127 family)
MTALSILVSRTLWSTITSFIDEQVVSLKEWSRVRAERAAIVRELSFCTDRELADMGFSRADFPAIASGTYKR